MIRSLSDDDNLFNAYDMQNLSKEKDLNVTKRNAL